MSQFYRVRFKTNLSDPRPVVFPPPGPYWVSGFGENYSIVVAYLKEKKELKKFWPEAFDADFEESQEIIFTERFLKPIWWRTKT
jgi:hypothetical protein